MLVKTPMLCCHLPALPGEQVVEQHTLGSRPCGKQVLGGWALAVTACRAHREGGLWAPFFRRMRLANWWKGKNKREYYKNRLNRFLIWHKNGSLEELCYFWVVQSWVTFLMWVFTSVKWAGTPHLTEHELVNTCRTFGESVPSEEELSWSSFFISWYAFFCYWKRNRLWSWAEMPALLSILCKLLGTLRLSLLIIKMGRLLSVLWGFLWNLNEVLSIKF